MAGRRTTGGRLALAAAPALLLLTSLAPGRQDERAELKGEIQNAIEKGKQFLIDKQFGNGTWAFLENIDQGEARTVGATALCGLALMECHVPPGDGRIQKAAQVIRKAARDVKFNFNYGVNLCILFLHRVNQGEAGGWNTEHGDAPLVRDLANRVMRGQNQRGGWGYYLTPGEQDNSNTQFGIVGLWVARKYFPEGKERDAVKAALVRAEQKFRGSQSGSGAWGYDSSNLMIQLQPTPSMTCAGLLGLAVGAGHRYESAFTGQGAGSGQTGGVYKKLDEDPLVKKAVLYLEGVLKGYADGLRGEHPVYFLWSLERTCVLYRWRKIGETDWHAVGSRFLISNQKQDGSWNLDHFNGTNAETAFALLFLVKSNLLGPLEDAEFTYGPLLAGPPAKAKPKTPVDVKVRINEVFAKLPTATPTERLALLQEAETLPGDDVTQNLAAAVKQMSSEQGKEAVRETLAKRLQPWTVTKLDQTLRESDHKEMRLAAARAAGTKTEPNAFDDAKAKADRHNLLISLITALSDEDKRLGDQAALTLQALTGQDFGKNQTRWSKWLDMNRGK